MLFKKIHLSKCLIDNVQLGLLVIRIPIPSPLVSEIKGARAVFSREKLDKTGSMLSTISGVNFTIKHKAKACKGGIQIIHWTLGGRVVNVKHELIVFKDLVLICSEVLFKSKIRCIYR
jgi:hypothetical protein